MFLLSVLLSAVTFAPAMQQHAPIVGVRTGVIQSDIMPDSTCKPGAICASKTTSYGKGCYFNNYYVKGSKGGTPLTIDVTETNSKTTYVYWVNTTNQNIGLSGKGAYANFYCP
jgi:hypothetical protein